jgi:hypothetical protein
MLDKLIRILLQWWKKPIFRIGLGVALVLILGGAAGGLYLTQIPPAQPINYPHSVHVGLGIQCLYCHTGATSGPVAGLPSDAKCWGCHQQIKSKSPEITKLADAVRSDIAIKWVPVAIEPDFVHFNHRAHLAAGLNCETCHGNVGKMTTAQPQKGQNMGWCLSCHTRMRPQKFIKLADCATCHY